MNKKSKFFLMLTTLFVFAITQTACTQQKNEINLRQSKPAEIAQPQTKGVAAAEPSVLVFNMVNVKQVVPNKMVDFTFLRDGQEVSLSEFAKDKFIFLNFWGTWCPPCRAEIPYLIDIAKELSDELVVVGVALERTTDIDEARKLVSDYSKKEGINYMNVVLNLENRNKITQSYGGIQFVPTTYLIDKEGNIVEKIQGGRTKEQFLESIMKMMKRS